MILLYKHVRLERNPDLQEMWKLIGEYPEDDVRDVIKTMGEGDYQLRKVGKLVETLRHSAKETKTVRKVKAK